MKQFINFGKQSHGRPPVVSLTPTDVEQLQSHYLATNRNKKEGSILLAWVRFCESRPELSHLVENHMPATTIPTAAVEACRAAKALVGPYRGGSARLRHEAAYVPGTMRRHHSEDRRLIAGERASVDDATRNIACYIPWPWGGCPCSEKYGVRLGRWQTLIVHDDATGYIPFVSSVFRWAQSYRGTDAATVIYRAERDVVQFDGWAIEGGVWQSKRALAVLGGRFISAKGRPNQKLVENAIGRLWNIMAGQPGDVGRHQAEMKSASELYVKCRAGREDPRKHFLSLATGQEALYESVRYLNDKLIDSRTYGKWVPKNRWESDLAEFPRAARTDSEGFLVLPCAETRKVRHGMVRITEEGPYGVPMVWTFAADWLWTFEGRQVTAYFDPLAEWPVHATLTLAGSRKPIGQVECLNSYGESKDRAADMVKSIRQSMMTETRVLATMHTERTVRHPAGVITSATSPVPDDPSFDCPGRIDPADDLDRSAAVPRHTREILAETPRISRDDLSLGLSRRASRLRDDNLIPHIP